MVDSKENCKFDLGVRVKRLAERGSQLFFTHKFWTNSWVTCTFNSTSRIANLKRKNFKSRVTLPFCKIHKLHIHFGFNRTSGVNFLPPFFMNAW